MVRRVLVPLMFGLVAFKSPIRDPSLGSGRRRQSAIIQGPATLQVGRVTAVYWPGEAGVARALAEIADRPVQWPGLGNIPQDSMRIIVSGSAARFESLTGARVPAWSAAVAFPASHTIVVRLKGDFERALRHELAHLALHAVVPGVPRWFDEGYAAWASGEWDRIDVLRVNWELARGAPPTFDDLNRDLQGGAVRAEAAYALAATAVQMLARIGGDQGLAPLISALTHTSNLDAALREAHFVTLDQFEELWQRDLRRRYGWLSFLTSATIFWGALTVVLVGAWFWRRRRDGARRLALDEGWELPPEGALPEEWELHPDETPPEEWRLPPEEPPPTA